MNFQDILKLMRDCESQGLKSNLHSHSQYCDGHATVHELAAAAHKAGMGVWGVSPHAPIAVWSDCNMKREDVPAYLADVEALKREYNGRMHVFTGMEVDYLSREFGPHIDYFQELPLDFRIGSVHFVPDQKGEQHDCDGSAANFARKLHDYYRDDLDYVVKRYFEQVLNMIDLGGFDLLGHFDKIAGNASAACADIEERGWYADLVADVIDAAVSRGLTAEINTKAIYDRQRLYPTERWWPLMREKGLDIVISTDCHYPEKADLGYAETQSRLASMK